MWRLLHLTYTSALQNQSMNEIRPKIPDPIQREVRQKCFFGCIFCGFPLFHYDHIIDYSIVKKHEAENLVLLCANHHFDKTSGRLTRDAVAEQAKRPFNKDKTFSPGYQIVPGGSVNVTLGTNSVKNQFSGGNQDHSCIWINGGHYLILHSEEQGLSISAYLTDTQGKPLLRIDHGEIGVNLANWDYEWVGKTITIREKLGSIILLADFSNEGIEIKKGSFISVEGDGFVIEKDRLYWMFDGKIAPGYSMGSLSESNGYGAFGLFNSKHCSLEKPSGFGFFRSDI